MAPRHGYDVRGAFEYENMLEAGMIEVKTCEPGSSTAWQPRMTDINSKVIADVLVFVGLLESYNPCDARLFAIPKSVLTSEVEKRIKRNPKENRPEISVSKNRVNNNTGQVNQWYEFELVNHSKLLRRITRYVHGDFGIWPEQLSLF